MFRRLTPNSSAQNAATELRKEFGIEAARIIPGHRSPAITEGRGRIVDEWKLRPERVDNHWLDCLVGCAVTAPIQGAILPGTDVKTEVKRKRVRLSELQRSKR